MKKAILSFALLLSAMNMMGQAYEFDMEENTSVEGFRLINCLIKDWAKLNASSPDMILGMTEFYTKDKAPVLIFELKKHRDQNQNSFAVVNELQDLELSIPEDAEYKNITINLYLSNGDILRGTNRGRIIPNLIPVEYVLDSGKINVTITPLVLMSSRSPKEVGTVENLRIICQQLRTYDIVKIEVDGVSFDVRGLRSAATYDAMFNALAQKTGKGHLYKYITVR